MVDGLFLRSVAICFNSLCILGVENQKIVLTPRCQSDHLLSSGHFLIVCHNDSVIFEFVNGISAVDECAVICEK